MKKSIIVLGFFLLSGCSGSTRNWSLMGDINQKQTRPQDKPVAVKNLDKDVKSIIAKYYPDLEGI